MWNNEDRVPDVYPSSDKDQFMEGLVKTLIGGELDNEKELIDTFTNIVDVGLLLGVIIIVLVLS